MTQKYGLFQFFSTIKYIYQYILNLSIMTPDITCVFQGLSNRGAIYISNLSAAQNTQLLANLSIEAVISVLRFKIVRYENTSVKDHLCIPVDDVQTQNLSQFFNKSFDFIQKSRKKTNILVHCYAGISRSATIVIAYLLRKFQYSLDNTISIVKRKRGKINPNKGFLQQLRKQALKVGSNTIRRGQSLEDILKKKHVKKEKVVRKLSLSQINGNVILEGNKTEGFSEKEKKTVQVKQNKLEKIFDSKLRIKSQSQSRNKTSQKRILDKILKIKEQINFESKKKNGLITFRQVRNPQIKFSYTKIPHSQRKSGIY